MNKDDIIRMAREAGIEDAHFVTPHPGVINQLERFAALVAEHKTEVAIAEAYRCGHEAGVIEEREECAKLCYSHVRQPSRLHFSEAIRARSKS